MASSTSTSVSSDIAIDVTKISDLGITENTLNVNRIVEERSEQSPKWWDIGPEKHREMYEKGQLSMPAPVLLPEAKDAIIPSREAGRGIPIRLYTPDNGKPSLGIFLHIHGGAFVLFSHKDQDYKLKSYANESQLTVISVGYRLAPKHAFPAGPQDCFDVAEYLVDHGEREYGAKLSFISGESAGATLATVTAFHLMRSRPSHEFRGILLFYGWYDLTVTLPGARSFTRQLVISTTDLYKSLEVYVPGMGIENRMQPSVSPLYEDMKALASATPSNRLPPVLFLCGTEDPLLEENVLMHMKWLATGSEAIFKLYPGGCHAFNVMPGLKIADEAKATTLQWIKEKAGYPKK